MKKKIIYSLSALGVVGWFSFWGYGNLYAMRDTKATDMLKLSIPHIVWEIQKENSTAQTAWNYIEEKKYHHVLLDDDYYYSLDVFGCDEEWFISAVPIHNSRHERNFLSRLLFLDFREVHYPIILGLENKYQHHIDNSTIIERFKEIENKCTVIDSIDLGHQIIYGD